MCSSDLARRPRTFVVGSSKSTSTKAISILSSKDGTPLPLSVLLTNEGPSLEKDEHWSKNKHGVDGMRKGDKNRVSSDDFRTLKPP